MPQASQVIDETGVVAILRGGLASELAPKLGSLIAGGVRAIEISLTTTDALGMIEAAVAIANGRATIGAGTVMARDEVAAVARRGAGFVVSPSFDPDVVRATIDAGMFSLPGIFTPTEAVLALRAGATAVKLFPADAVGPAFVRAILAPMPRLRIVPTGGVSLDLARQFADAGAWAVGVGRPLVDAGAGRELETRARAFVAAMRPASLPR